MTLFTDLAVVPVTRVHQHVARGGPIWPGFAQQTWVRHCRDRKPWDEKPDMPDRLLPFGQPAVWGGFLDSHFGHFVADHLPRLAIALQERPGDAYLYTVDPGMTRDGVGNWVWQIFDWIGLPSDQVHLVTEGLYVAELRVAKQAEMLAQVRPSAAYLTAIGRWSAGLQVTPTPMLYVSRMGLPQKGGGAHAGEGYLVGLLRQLGLAVLDPAKVTIRQQMAAYAGAGRLIFAEGSALHGRQLLGHVAQDIDVLRRRPGKVMAKAALKPRCRRLTYHNIISGQLMAYWKSGAQRPDPALSLYDVAALIRVFQGFGVDLAGHWDQAGYLKEVGVDVAAWVAERDPQGERKAEYVSVLTPLGLA